MVMPGSDPHGVRIFLRKTLTERLSPGELRTLCFDLGVDYDDLAGDTKPTKILALLEYLEDREQLPSLLVWLATNRPDVDLRRETPAPSAALADVHTALQRLDDVELETLALQHAPQVYDKFSRGLRRDEKINLLLDYCRRYPQEAERLRGVVRSTGGPAERPAEIRGEARPPQAVPTAPVRNRWALLVGINQYIDPTFSPLRFCVDDTVDLREALQGAGYTAVALHDDVAEERLLPTRDNVEAELARICEVADKDDLIWAHFSCHGKVVQGKPVLITRESRAPTLGEKALPLTEVERRLRGSRARRLILTLDACHTGVEMGRDAADPEFIRNAYELAEGFAMLAASTSQQVAQEWKEKAHGVFTHFLLQGLSGQADRGRKRFVTVGDLVTYTLDGLRRWNVEHGGLLQEPTARFEGMGDMILADHR